MGLESASFIPELNSGNPIGSSDPKSQGDDHLRLIKAALLGTFPNFVGTSGTPKSISLTEDELNDASQKLADETIAGDKTHTGFLVTDDSTTTRAGFNIPTGVEPTSPNQGDMWVTATDIFAYIDGVASSLLGGGGGQSNFPWLPPNGNITLTNQSIALLYFANDSDFRTKMDLSSFTEVRLISHVLAAGFTGAFHEVRYATSFESSQGSYLTLGDTAVRIVHDTGNVIEDTGWINLVAGAKLDNTFLALVMDDGDGIEDPVVRQVMMYLK